MIVIKVTFCEWSDPLSVEFEDERDCLVWDPTELHRWLLDLYYDWRDEREKVDNEQK